MRHLLADCVAIFFYFSFETIMKGETQKLLGSKVRNFLHFFVNMAVVTS
jgi:hypothetical protein